MNPEIQMNNDIENEENRKRIIEQLFPEQLPTTEELEGKYPPRELKEGAMVTRIAPSPTGFMHIGGLYTALISERLAHQTEGVFFLRIEDTDKKREVAGASELISSSLKHYGIKIEEGPTTSGAEVGRYGPYKQSDRGKIYQAYVKHLVEKGEAYPCFCSNDELEEMRQLQESQEIRPGYYKQWAQWRNKSEQEVLQALKEKREFVIRYKSQGDSSNRIFINDILLGSKELPENDQDFVILKSDGLPTYHMAHVIDDHLMRTTHVIRGNEWLSSLPLHLQLFKALGWQPPEYGHIFPIQKMEGPSKRKLSKRKDPEANVTFYDAQGYPEDSVVEYLLNLANSSFEDWRKSNPDKNNLEFNISLDGLSSSNGPLFDSVKLNDISKEIIARYSAEEVYIRSLRWAKKYDVLLAKEMEEDPEYTKKILAIERGSGSKTRKDIKKWSDLKNEIRYFFDQDFKINKDEAARLLPEFKKNDIKTIIDLFVKSYNEKNSADEWFDKVKEIARVYGYAESTKEFKKNPEKYKGSIANIVKIFRVLLTGRTQTPDLYSVMQVMGQARVLSRLSIFN